MKKKLWNRDFILLLQGNAVSTIGDMMYSIAIGYWVYENTGSSGLMGLMSAISMIVSMLLSFTGSVIDKCNRKWLIVAIDSIQGIIMLGVSLMAYTNTLNIPIVLITAFIAAVSGAFYSPAVSTIKLDIIPHDDMVRGQSIFSGIASVINTTGNAFSGVMVAFFGVPFIVAINGISNLYSAVSEFFINVPKTIRQGEHITLKSILQDTMKAVMTIFKDKHLKLFIPCALLVNLLAAGPFSLMLPFCLEKGLTVDMYGYLISIFTVASLVCTLMLSVIKFKARTRYRLMSFGYIGSVIILITVYMSENVIPMYIMMFAASFMMCAGNTIFNSSLMLALPEENRGAILGFMSSAPVGGSALSALIYGFLGDIFPLHLIFAIGTTLSIVPMVYTFFNRRIREFILAH